MSIIPPGSTASPSAMNWQTQSSRVQLVQEMSNWKIGDTHTARVQTVLTDTQSANQTAMMRVLLNINGRLVEANLPLPVKAGDQLLMTLRSQNDLQLQLSSGLTTILSLKTLAAASTSAPSLTAALLNTARLGQTSPTVPLEAALGRLMPFQGRLLETLGALLQLPQARLSPELAPLLALLRSMIPPGPNLASPEALKQAMRQSGAFAERQLLDDPSLAARLFARAPGGAMGEPIPRDFKLLLLRLFVLLSRPQTQTTATQPQTQATTANPSARPTAPLWQPGGNPVGQPLQFPHPEFLRPQGRERTAALELNAKELLKLIAQGLSRIQATQLNSLLSPPQAHSDTTPAATWLLELPAWSGQQLSLFQVRLEEYKQQQEPSNSSSEERGSESVWRITLSFNLEPLGPMYSLVRIQRGKVSSSFWTENDNTLRLLERELPHLRQALSKLGLEVEQLEALRGVPSFTQTRLETQLIDIRT